MPPDRRSSQSTTNTLVAAIPLPQLSSSGSASTLATTTTTDPSPRTPPKSTFPRLATPCITNRTPLLSVTFTPIAPQDFNRYEHGRYLDNTVTDVVVPPLSRSIHQESLLEWTPHEHPEGALYFRYVEKNIFTDVDLYNPDELRRLTFCVEAILRYPRAAKLLASSVVNLVLDILPNADQGHLKCSYYFVDHSERVILWIHDFPMSQLVAWRRVPGITSDTHIKLGLEVEYWRHAEYFPSALPISMSVLRELRNRIIFAIADAMTSPTTTVQAPTDYLSQMLPLVDALAVDFETLGESLTDVGTPARIIDNAWGVVVGRFMAQFALARFHNFNGEHFARLDRSNSVYGPPEHPRPYFTLISILLFNSPAAHLPRIQIMYKDGILNCLGWKEFIHELRSEWQETILFGTLILNANVGFLAISPGALTSPAQILSYLSVFFGFGSVVTGFILSRQYGHEFRHPCSSSDTTQFFIRRSVIGFPALAMLYSLPSTFMLWGMITFVVAFFIMAVQSTTGAIRIFVVIVFAAIFVSAVGYMTAEHCIRFIQADRARRAPPRRWAEKLHVITCNIFGV
ncbi:hypothetical protein C8F04DRAFT_1403752 [Mycena alexandri]|uniref:Uncharacterized protein n=1 Tax=Mycena alexandri TaxID=1745969 RepID=A0AAD6S4Q3_9AGAR|nr:hypothetical protein C8F04DRAFT_1403752 [Mycena alexandri]